MTLTKKQATIAAWLLLVGFIGTLGIGIGFTLRFTLLSCTPTARETATEMLRNWVPLTADPATGIFQYRGLPCLETTPQSCN